MIWDGMFGTAEILLLFNLWLLRRTQTPSIVVVGQYDGWILAVCTNGCTISNVRDLLVDGLTVDGSL